MKALLIDKYRMLYKTYMVDKGKETDMVKDSIIAMSRTVFEELKTLLCENVRFTSLKSVFRNIKRNILLIISAAMFIMLNIRFSIVGILSFIMSFAWIVVFFSQVTDITKRVKESPFLLKIYSLISAAGICYYTRIISVNYIFTAPIINKLCVKINIDSVFFTRWFSTFGVLFAFIAVFVFVLFLLSYVISKLKPLYEDLTKMEILIGLLITTALLALVCYSFLGSSAFWGSDMRRDIIPYDIIYTSDSASLIKNNVYLNLYHGQNDLRQPLFAVFSAPFIGFGYAISIPLSSVSKAFVPLLMNCIQIFMLVIANIMLAKILKLKSIKRVLFVLAITVTYPSLLFSLMMEQYIIAYFWLVFSIYLYFEKKSTTIAITAAGGTLLTSLILLPPLSYSSRVPNRLNYFVRSVEEKVLTFIAALLAFGRFDVILNAFSTSEALSRFAGGVGITGRINQYVSFVSSCFVAPHAIIDTEKYDYISWQLSNSSITSINIIGVIILLLCAVSFIVNRKNTLSKITGAWVLFSVIMLCAIGWGSDENGMILYTLYFAWAFYVLLYQLIEWVSDKIHFKYFTLIVGSITIILLVFFNYKGISVLLDFAFTYYSI